MDHTERRERYAAAIWRCRETGDDEITAVMAVADEEITARLNAESGNASRYRFERDAAHDENARLREERDALLLRLRRAEAPGVSLGAVQSAERGHAGAWGTKPRKKPDPT